MPISSSELEPDYTASLPYACHPAQVAAYSAKIATFTAGSSSARDAFLGWLDHSTRRIKPFDLVNRLDNTAIVWRTLTLCSSQLLFEKRLKAIMRNGKAFDMRYADVAAAETKHTSLYLHYLAMYERQGNLVMACRPMVDYLQANEKLMSVGWQGAWQVSRILRDTAPLPINDCARDAASRCITSCDCHLPTGE